MRRPGLRSRTRLTVVGLLGGLAVAGGAATARGADHAIIMVIDGVRASEAFDDPAHAHVPRMWNDLRPLGVRIPQFRNEGWTQTVPGHSSLLTGTWQFLPNDGTERPTAPTLFEYSRAFSGSAASDAWLVTGKSKLGACSYSTAPGYGAPDSALSDCADRSDAATTAAFVAHLAADHPRIALFHLGDVDVIAHQGDWDGYLRAIATADSLVYETWMFIESDPSLAGRTDLLVTCDHGRHDDAHGGFMSHGDGCEGCRRLLFLAVGPDFAAGRESHVTRTQRDVAPTLGVLLGFPTPEAEGAVMSELWEPATGVPSSPPHRRTRVAPNPSPGAVRFRFASELTGDSVVLRIWDLGGRLVYEERGPAQGMTWDAADGGGRPAAAGAYFWEVSGTRIEERGTFTLVR
jgi:hypothetical protein